MLPGRARSPPHPEHPSSRGAAGAALVPQRWSRQLFPALCGRELPGDSSSLAASSPQPSVLFAASVSPPGSSEGCQTLWMDTQGCTSGGCTFRDAHLGVMLTQGCTSGGMQVQECTSRDAHLGGCMLRDAHLGDAHLGEHKHPPPLMPAPAWLVAPRASWPHPQDATVSPC